MTRPASPAGVSLWSMMRARLSPIAFVLEPLTRPIVIALFAPLFGVPIAPAVLLAVIATLGRDAAGWLLLRGRHGPRQRPITFVTTSSRVSW